MDITLTLRIITKKIMNTLQIISTLVTITIQKIVLAIANAKKNAPAPAKAAIAKQNAQKIAVDKPERFL